MNIFDMLVLAPGPYPHDYGGKQVLGAHKIREKLRCQEGRADPTGMVESATGKAAAAGEH